MQSLIGTFNFACKVVTPSRTFLRRLIDLTRGVHNPNHLLRINYEARADLSAWKLFLDSFNGVSLCLPVSWTSSHCIQLYSDESFIGFAAVFRERWFQGFFHQSRAKINTAVKELFPIAIAARLWAPLMANSRIIFMCDNMSIVHVINYHTSKDTAIMRLLRQLMRGPLAQRERRPSTSRGAALVTSAGVYITASLAPSLRALYAKSLLRLPTVCPLFLNSSLLVPCIDCTDLYLQDLPRPRSIRPFQRFPFSTSRLTSPTQPMTFL